MTIKSAKDNILLLVSKNLKRLRSLHNLSQLELAEKAFLSSNFINNIENCEKGISIETLAKLCVALKVDPHQFFLSDEMLNNETRLYAYALRDTVIKAVNEVMDPYLPEKTQKK